MDENPICACSQSQPIDLTQESPKTTQSTINPVYVEWIDAYGINSGWTDIASLKDKDLSVISLGYKVIDEPTYIGITSTIDEVNNMCHNCIIIPKPMIKKYIDLEAIQWGQ